MTLRLSQEVKHALSTGLPVVALESTLVAHGLPWPENHEVGLAVEAAVRASGAVPATVAVVHGELTVGIDAATLERLAHGGFRKVTEADLGPCIAGRHNGATTVSATAFAAARAGIRVFATGGIGGVHRGNTGDVSSDLTALAAHPVVVVSAGAKAILDLPRTLETLETLRVLVLGYRTSQFPAFYTRSTGLPLEHRVDDAEAAAHIIAARLGLGGQGGVLVCNPIPEADALDTDEVDVAITDAVQAAERSGVRGKALTPFLLSAVARATAHKSLHANRALVLHNARVASDIAVALARVHPRS